MVLRLFRKPDVSKDPTLCFFLIFLDRKERSSPRGHPFEFFRHCAIFLGKILFRKIFRFGLLMSLVMKEGKRFGLVYFW